jgi:NADP-dependent 3-hydroxy acid dehydrogenase YdfG
MKSGNEQICVVSGASSGIGFAIAKALLEENHKVIVTARRAGNLENLDADPD